MLNNIVGKIIKVLLVFNNDERIATIEISEGKKSLFSSSKTKVKIAINHPNSIKDAPVIYWNRTRIYLKRINWSY